MNLLYKPVNNNIEFNSQPVPKLVFPKESILPTHSLTFPLLPPPFPLKGLGHEIEFKYFDKKGYF